MAYPPFHILSLCSGTAMLDEGVSAAVPGSRVVAYVERESCAAATLLARMEEAALEPTPIWCGNLETFDGGAWAGAVDCLTAGFPCQPWSAAGKREGIADARWIWPAIAGIIAASEVPSVFLENVPGLAVGLGLNTVLGDLARMGFDAEWCHLSAASVGAPPINENASSFWPSARSEDAESCGNHPNGASDSLTGVTSTWSTASATDMKAGLMNTNGRNLVRETMQWQTPAADSFRSRSGERVSEMGLDQQARMFWPTPDAMSGGPESQGRKKQLGRTESGGGDLAAIVECWPSVGANDWKGSAAPGQRRGQLDEAAEQIFSHPDPAIPAGQQSSANSPSSRRRLNPAFAAWLMGMPWWWTNPAPISYAQSEMALWRCRLRQRLESLLRGC